MAAALVIALAGGAGSELVTSATASSVHAATKSGNKSKKCKTRFVEKHGRCILSKKVLEAEEKKEREEKAKERAERKKKKKIEAENQQEEGSRSRSRSQKANGRRIRGYEADEPIWRAACLCPGSAQRGGPMDPGRSPHTVSV
jgi:hypothetical protein